MADFKYEGVTQDINEKQLQFIGEMLEKRGFKNNRIVVEVVGGVGDNYMANVKRITVEDAELKPFKMIAKIAPSNEVVRAAVHTNTAFSNEHLMYTEIFPKFKAIQLKSQVSKEDMFRFAECYGSYTEAPNEVILLEDLNESNFIMLNRFEPLNNECVRSILRNFAILHSISFAFRANEPQLFEEYKTKLVDLWDKLHANTDNNIYMAQLEEHILKLVSDDDKRTEALKKSQISNIPSVVSKLLKTDSASKRTVIQQGDAWTNNFMFKFDGDKLLESVMIDYQNSKEANPVTDLLHMICNCTDHQTRLQYYHEWIDYYHTELDKALSNYGLKASLVYSRDHLDVDLKRYGKAMLSISLILASILTANTEDVAKMKKDMESTDSFDLNKVSDQLVAFDNKDLLKARIEGLIDSFVAFGLI